MTTISKPRDNRPWYKQFWPWFVIALPASSVVAGLTTVAIAFKNQDSVVRDDWYKDGKAINESLEREKRATALGVVATIGIDTLTGDVQVRLDGKETPPEALTLHFSHPTQAERDQNVALTRQADGSFRGSLRNALDGRYYIDLGTPEWNLQTMETFPQESLTLRASQ